MPGKSAAKRLRIALLEPGRRLGRVGELPGDPGGRLIDAGFLDVLPPGPALAVGSGLLLRDPLQLVGVLEVGSDLPLLERPFDRVDDHRVGIVGRHDEDLLAGLQDAHALALQARLVANEGPGRRHQVVDGFRRLEVGGPARRGIFLTVGADLGCGRGRFGAGRRRAGTAAAAPGRRRTRTAQTPSVKSRMVDALLSASPAPWIGLTFAARDVTHTLPPGQLPVRRSPGVRSIISWSDH